MVSEMSNCKVIRGDRATTPTPQGERFKNRVWSLEGQACQITYAQQHQVPDGADGVIVERKVVLPEIDDLSPSQCKRRPSSENQAGKYADVAAIPIGTVRLEEKSTRPRKKQKSMPRAAWIGRMLRLGNCQLEGANS